MDNSILSHSGYGERESISPAAADPEVAQLTARPIAGGEDEALCLKCSRLASANFFYQEPDEGSFPIRGFEAREGLAASSCPLCRLFAKLARDPVDNGKFVEYQVQLLSTSWVFTGLGAGVRDPEGLFRPTNVLAITPCYRAQMRERDIWGNVDAREDVDEYLQTATDADSYNFPLRSYEKTGFLSVGRIDGKRAICEIREVDRAMFDLSLADKWISYCETNHGIACSNVNLPDLVDFRVFDCHKRRVIHAPRDCRYVALSYVWARHESRLQCALSTQMEKVIEDSIVVTKSLGFDFPWVDRICIDQADEQQKMKQIRQMDSIYARATLTIIAAAGGSPNHGLPGIGGTLRVEQENLVIGSTTLLSTLPAGAHTIRESAWNTRGWTFQEGMLSTRRLIFTDAQVFFECNSMHCSEAVRTPLGLMHGATNKFDMFAYAHSALPNKAPGSHPADFMDFVHRYTSRHLTYPMDRLNAFEGVMNAFKRAKRPVYSFWGVPIFMSDNDMSRRPRYDLWDEDKTDRAERSLAVRFAISLFWQHESLSTRMKQFPSWSWAGWTGKIHPQVLALVDDELSTGLDISLESDVHGIMSLDSIEFWSQMGSLEDTYSSRLYIEAWTIPVNIDKLDVSDFPYGEDDVLVNGYYASFTAQPNGTLYSKLQSYEEHREFSPVQTFLGFILRPTAKRESNRQVGMVLENVGDHYERIGLFHTDETFGRNDDEWNFDNQWNDLDWSRRGFWLG